MCFLNTRNKIASIFCVVLQHITFPILEDFSKTIAGVPVTSLVNPLTPWSMSSRATEIIQFSNFLKFVLFFNFLKINLYFIYLFLAALGLHCCTRAFSSCGERGLLFVVVRRLLIVVASVVEHGLQ